MNALEPTPRRYRVVMALIGWADRWFKMSCRAFARLASKQLDTPLRGWERLAFRMHGRMCHYCRDHAADLAQLQLHAKQAEPPPLDESTRERLRARLR